VSSRPTVPWIHVVRVCAGSSTEQGWAVALLRARTRATACRAPERPWPVRRGWWDGRGEGLPASAGRDRQPPALDGRGRV